MEFVEAAALTLEPKFTEAVVGLGARKLEERSYALSDYLLRGGLAAQEPEELRKLVDEAGST